MDETEGSVWIHKFKCFPCGLHFSLYSWNKDWAIKHDVFCPECGKQHDGSAFSCLYWRENSHLQIFEHIPGQFSEMK